jgi:hypothetical protein
MASELLQLNFGFQRQVYYFRAVDAVVPCESCK